MTPAPPSLPAQTPLPDPLLALERQHWSAGHRLVAGVDEAGRGAWAGPLTVAAVVLPPGEPDEWWPFDDSKALTPARREFLAGQVRAAALAWAVEHVWPEEIDRLNVLRATHLGAARALARLSPAPDALITDYLRLDTALPLLAPPRADSSSRTVAAASLLAKTERDALMVRLDAEHPGYGLAAHKGYGAPAHREALERLGVSPLHRRSYAPVRALL